MTHIEQMIQDMCPNGVEFKTLGEVCEIHDAKRKPVTKSQRASGEYPYYGANGIQDYVNDYIFDGTFLLIGEDGSVINKDKSPVINWAKGKIWVNNHAHILSEKKDIVLLRFLYYYLQTIDVSDLVWGAELQAELQLRRKQYEYYRTQLLTPHSDCNSATKPDDCKWEWKTLGEIGEMIKGSGIQKSDFVEEGKPCIHYGQVHTFYGTFAYKNKSYISEELYAKCKKAHTGDLVIATTSEDVEACCKATAWLGDEDVAVSGDAHIYRHTQNPKYMAYLFQTEMFAQQKRRCATGAKVTRVHGDDMLKFRFPLPSLAEQERIVSILDKFEALTTSLSDGIPAEQAAQQRRYEYYRDLLLTFDRKAV